MNSELISINSKPRLGAALLISDWFIETAGIDGTTNDEYAALGKQLEEDVDKILSALRAHFDVVSNGLIATEKEAQTASDAFNAEKVDAIIIVHVMWSNDFPLIRIMRECGDIPAMLWCYNPFKRLPETMGMNDLFRASGSVGMLQGSAPMKKHEFDFEFCFGAPEDECLKQKLSDFAGALCLKRELKTCRVGQIGPQCECMTGTYVDEIRLRKTFGISVIPISVARLAEEADSVPEEKVDQFAEELKSGFRITDVDDDALNASAKATLAVEKLVLDEDLDIVSMEDLDEEMHALLKTRPSLWTETMTERGTVVVMERDTISGVGMYICSALMGSPSMYGEIFTCDMSENAIVFGHAGMHDPRVAGSEVTIIKDMEYYQTDETAGAWRKFIAKPGDVTLVSMFSDRDGYRVVSFKGYVEPGVDKMPFGFSHAFIRCEKDLDHLYENLVRNGLTQHFSLCWGDIGEKLRMFCRLMRIEYVEL